MKQRSNFNKFSPRRTAAAMAVMMALGANADTFAVTSTLNRTATTANVSAGATNTQSATKSTDTANVAGTQSVTTITVNSAPLATETLTVGSCVVTFVAGNSTSLQDSVDCTSNAATIDLTSDGTAARDAAALATALRTLSNVAGGGGFGALTVGGSGTDITLTAANKVAGNPATATTNNTNAFGGAFASANTTAGVAPVAQIDTITISGTIEAGDVFTATLPGPVTASYTALTGNTADDVATGLNSAIQASAGYGAQAFTSGVATNVVTLTAKVAGTGFAVTSTATNQAAVAQVDTFTPASVTAGERFRVTIGGTNYDYVAQTGDTATLVSNGLRAAISNATVTENSDGNATVVLTAVTPGTAFTATSSVLANLAYSTTTLTEAGGNHGYVGYMTLTLTGDTFTGADLDNFVTAGKVTVSNVPTGMTAAVYRLSSTSVGVYLTNAATNHAAANSIADLTVTFANSAFTGGSAAGVGNASRNDLQISFYDSDSSTPTISAYSPADDATGVTTTGVLSLTFNEPVTAVSGKNIYLKQGGSTVETIAANDTTKVTVSSGKTGASVYINPTTVLTASTAYNVEIDAGAFVDTNATPNAYAGIADATTWNFTTGVADVSAPTASSLVPADNATNINPSADLSITFSEYVQAGAGNIVIKKSSDDSIVETIAANDTSKVTITNTSGSKATINPAATLALNTSYYVEIDATAFKDKADNAYAGISGNSTWNFTTKATDTFAPSLRTVSLGTPSSSGITVSGKVNEDATGYYVVMPSTATWPTSAEVAAGTGYSGATPVASGSVAMTADTMATINVTGLSPSTSYYLYFTAKDSANNLTVYTGSQAYYYLFTTAAAVATPTGDSGTYVEPTPSEATIPAGVDVPEGTSLVFVTNLSNVLDGSAGNTAGITLKGGMLQVDTDTLSTTGMNFSGNVQDGTAFMLNDSASNKDVPITLNGNTIEVNPEGNTLMTIGTVTMEDGTTFKALVVTSGGASLNGDKAGELLGALGGAGNAPINASEPGTKVSVSSGTNGGTVSVSSGSAEITVSGLDGDFAATNKFAADTKQKVKLYAGEKANLTKAGKLSSITLGNGKNSAGDPLSLSDKPASLTINATVPNLNATAARANGKLAEVVATTLNATLEGEGQNTSGSVVLKIGGKRIVAMPVGEIKAAPSRTDGVTVKDNGLVEVVSKGVVTTFAPAATDINELVAALPSGATLNVNGNGVIQASIGENTYYVRPSWYAGQGGASGYNVNANQTITFTDSKGNLTTLSAAFANYDALLEGIAKEIPGASAKVNTDGTVVMTINGSVYTLTPEMVKPKLGVGGPPAIFAGKRWWQESDGKLFLNVGGAIQNFAVR